MVYLCTVQLHLPICLLDLQLEGLSLLCDLLVRLFRRNFFQLLINVENLFIHFLKFLEECVEVLFDFFHLPYLLLVYLLLTHWLISHGRVGGVFLMQAELSCRLWLFHFSCWCLNLWILALKFCIGINDRIPFASD